MFPAHVFMCQKVARKRKLNTSKWVSLLVDLNLRMASRQENCTSYYQSKRTREDLDGIQNHTETHFAHLLAPLFHSGYSRLKPQVNSFHWVHCMSTFSPVHLALASVALQTEKTRQSPFCIHDLSTETNL
jgi:hypothetical protein